MEIVRKHLLLTPWSVALFSNDIIIKENANGVDKITDKAIK